MEKLIIEPTKYTPQILFDPDAHILEIRGESYPENISGFYEPIFEWLASYFEEERLTNVTVNVEMRYFNSSSSKMFLDFFDMMEEVAAEKDTHITVNWHYDEENEMILEYGEEFKEDLPSLAFNLVKREK